MATTTKAWSTGSGYITLTYGGQGNGTITVTSDDNDVDVQRSETITVRTGSLVRTVTVRQAASPNFQDADGKFIRLSDGTYLNVQNT